MALPALLKVVMCSFVGIGGVGLLAGGAYYLSKTVEAISWILIPVLLLFAVVFLVKLYKIVRQDFSNSK